jgi:hypothetical protein
MLAVTITVVVLLTMRRGRLTPEARYRRDVRGIQMATYVETTPRYTPQQGDPGITSGGTISAG